MASVSETDKGAELRKKRCVPCEGGVPPLTREEIDELLPQLSSNWEVVDDHHLRRSFLFRDYAEALAFVNRISVVAEEEGHHPDICFTWGKCTVEIFTHAIDGLSESDFILAAKFDPLYIVD